MTCQHREFSTLVGISRHEESAPVSFSASIRIECVDCRVSMRFLGLPCGSAVSGATVSADGAELRCAIAPEGEVRAAIDGAARTTRSAPLKAKDTDDDRR